MQGLRRVAMVPVTQQDRAARLAPNALRTILFVAAKGAVGRTALGAFQRTLPPGEWGDLELTHGWSPLKPFLSWTTAPLGIAATRSVREVLALLVAAVNRDHSGELGRLAGDLRYLLCSKSADSTLDAPLVVPRTELGVRLSRARRNATKRAYEAALRDCAAPPPMEGKGIDLVAAAQALRAALDGMTPPVLYEATDHGVVARALLAKQRSTRLLHARCHVVLALGVLHRVHRLYVFARLGRAELALAARPCGSAVGPMGRRSWEGHPPDGRPAYGGGLQLVPYSARRGLAESPGRITFP